MSVCAAGVQLSEEDVADSRQRREGSLSSGRLGEQLTPRPSSGRWEPLAVEPNAH